MKQTPKTFFKEPTAGKILKYERIKEIRENIVNNIMGLGEHEAGVIYADLIPRTYESPRKFMKHGTDVKLHRFSSLEDVLEKRLTPVQIREIAFNKIYNIPYCGYSIKPFAGTDQRTRKVSLVECVEAAKLYKYSNPSEKKSSIIIKPYDDARRVAKDGAEIIAIVPSRTENQDRHKFKFSSVPVTDNNDKYGIAYNISTDHSCSSKRFNIRYKFKDDKESSRVFNFCAHEIAAYMSIIDHYWNNDKNIIPLQMSQFAIPTQKTVDYYDKLCNNALIQTSYDVKPRKLNNAEKEILLWNLVYKEKHDATFFSRKGRDKDLREYRWRNV